VKINSWFEISEKEYIWYKLQGYTIDADDHRVIWVLDSKFHRTDGPAVIGIGYQAWYLNDKRHRTDGPAYIQANGTQGWYLNGKRHRTDGPAVIRANGDRAWYLNDNLHRTDGPAVILANDASRQCSWAAHHSRLEWWVNGREYTEQEWQNALSELV
jgi:hypothetical protein